jgi:hypothetical protein
MMKKVALAAVLAVVLSYGVSVSMAQEDGEVKAPESVDAELSGVNIGLLSTLAKDEVVGAPEPFAQMNVLKVESAIDIANGEEIAEVKGKILYYVPVEDAAPLLAGEGSRNKQVKVVGKLFKNERAILVEIFEAEGADEWDELPVGNQSGLAVL